MKTKEELAQIRKNMMKKKFNPQAAANTLMDSQKDDRDSSIGISNIANNVKIDFTDNTNEENKMGQNLRDAAMQKLPSAKDKRVTKQNRGGQE